MALLIWGYALVSVIVVSLLSFVGVLTLFVKGKKLRKLLLFLVSLSAGSLFGDAFLHLLPETVTKEGFTIEVSLLVLLGVVVFFVLEKFIHWRHRHGVKSTLSKGSRSHLAVLNLVGDGIHNFVDGLVIAGSYLVSVPVGMATTFAVIFHEIPQEFADFGVLLYAGLSKGRALFFNFLSALTAVVGTLLGLLWGASSSSFVDLTLPFAAGGFLYIAGSNLIPELHKECRLKDSFSHLFAMLLGIGLMVLLKVFG